MAYAGETPWHSLGQEVNPDESLEEWKKKSGLIWDVLEHPVFFNSSIEEEYNEQIEIPSMKALVRSDNLHPLSIVSQQYKTIQPKTIIEFYKDLVEQYKFKMETLGSLKDGAKVWALAKIGDGIELPGNDLVNGYLLLTTSYDRTLSTTAMLTSVRVVCNNTLHLAMNGNNQRSIRVRHNAFFKADEVKMELGLINDSWSKFSDNIVLLSNKKIRKKTAENWIKGFCKIDDGMDINDTKKISAIGIRDLYFNGGQGSDLKSSKNTAWGLLNAVTEYVDHYRKAKTVDTRLNAIWYGRGSVIKAQAYDSIMKLAV